MHDEEEGPDQRPQDGPDDDGPNQTNSGESGNCEDIHAPRIHHAPVSARG